MVHIFNYMHLHKLYNMLDYLHIYVKA